MGYSNERDVGKSKSSNHAKRHKGAWNHPESFSYSQIGMFIGYLLIRISQSEMADKGASWRGQFRQAAGSPRAQGSLVGTASIFCCLCHSRNRYTCPPSEPCSSCKSFAGKCCKVLRRKVLVRRKSIDSRRENHVASCCPREKRKKRKEKKS